MSDLILTSFTPISAGGGVPRWNRDMKGWCPAARHYSWDDIIQVYGDSGAPEWEKAKILNRWLVSTGRIKKDDVVVADGFWAAGLEDHPNVVSVCHGIWSHLTNDDVIAGRQPEFPTHHAVQVDFRRKHLERRGRLVSVSDFITDQMRLQWGFESFVINNAIDLNSFCPRKEYVKRDRPLIIHGVTTSNKGFDHIDILKGLDVDVMLLDEAQRRLNIPKYDALAQADLVVHPSAYEGNSYFVLESLACDVPIIGYDVGLMYQAVKERAPVGWVISGRQRSPEKTFEVVKRALELIRPASGISTLQYTVGGRVWAKNFSIEKFGGAWKSYLEKEFGFKS